MKTIALFGACAVESNPCGGVIPRSIQSKEKIRSVREKEQHGIIKRGHPVGVSSFYL